MNHAEKNVAPRYEFAGYALDAAQRTLVRAGEPVTINPKAFDALVYLLDRAGTVVTREELTAELWPRTVVEDNNLTQTITAVRRALNDGDAQQLVATVPRRGYQIVVPVRRLERDKEPTPRTSTARFRTPLLAAISVLVLAGVGVLWWQSQRQATSRDAPSMPAAGRPSQSAPAYAAYLKALALYRSSGSIGVSMPPQVRQSIRAYLDESIVLDPKFAAALGWRAQLSADSQQFDSFSPAEHAARLSELQTAIARDARDALSIDPGLGIAYAALSRLHTYQFRIADAVATLEQAQRVAPDDTTIWQAAAIAHCMGENSESSIAAARRAIELDPQNPGPYSLLGISLRVSGRYDEAVAAHTRMIELAPTALIGYVALARTLTAKGDSPRLREMLQVAEQFLGDARNFRLDIALIYASIGEHKDAQRLVDEFRRRMEGKYVDPALEAMAFMATGQHEAARGVLRRMLASGRRGMDQLPLVLIRHNVWTDPALETSDWIELRKALAYRGE